MARLIIYDYCQDIIRNIDLHVEKMIKEINEKRNELIDRVHAHQQSLLKKLESANSEQEKNLINKQLFNLEFEETHVVSNRLVGVLYNKPEVQCDVEHFDQFELIKHALKTIAFASSDNDLTVVDCSSRLEPLENGCFINYNSYGNNDIRFSIVSDDLKSIIRSGYFINLSIPNLSLESSDSRRLITTSNQKIVLVFDNELFTRACVLDYSLILIARRDFSYKLNSFVANRNYILIKTFEEVDMIRVYDFDLNEINQYESPDDLNLVQFTDSNQMLVLTKPEYVYKIYATNDFGLNIAETGESCYPFISIYGSRLLNQNYLAHWDSSINVLSIENLRKKASKRINLPSIDLDGTSIHEMISQNFKLVLKTQDYILKFNDSIFF
jgi:hypothetical protein